MKISEDQNTVHDDGKELEAVESGFSCAVCHFNAKAALSEATAACDSPCAEIPCVAEERADRKNVVFTEQTNES